RESSNRVVERSHRATQRQAAVRGKRKHEHTATRHVNDLKQSKLNWSRVGAKRQRGVPRTTLGGISLRAERLRLKRGYTFPESALRVVHFSAVDLSNLG
ncbi:MAG TPA: hypothetical protein VK477_13970, partial [Acidobacteriota bacterium]|nr:hypothetical protein [Acidobacteriota bacterium]